MLFAGAYKPKPCSIDGYDGGRIERETFLLIFINRCSAHLLSGIL